MKQTNLYIHQGTDYFKNLFLEHPKGVAFNPTGFTLDAKLRKSVIYPTAIPFTVTVIDAPKGEIKLNLNNATTTALSVHKYAFTIDAVNNTTAEIIRVAEGQGIVHYTVL